MEQMHINNLNYEELVKRRSTVEIIRKATNLNNNLPSDKKLIFLKYQFQVIIK